MLYGPGTQTVSYYTEGEQLATCKFQALLGTDGMH